MRERHREEQKDRHTRNTFASKRNAKKREPKKQQKKRRRKKQRNMLIVSSYTIYIMCVCGARKKIRGNVKERYLNQLTSIIVIIEPLIINENVMK